MDKKPEVPENRKVDLLWDENDRRKINIVSNKKGRYILGYDPYRKITLWHRFWMFFGLYRNIRDGCITMVFDKNGLLKYAYK